jgi:hypothetical protein
VRKTGGRAGYGADQVDKCDPWHVGKRPSFIETATNRLSFLVDEQGFIGPETEKDIFVPGISKVRYHRNDTTIEVVHVVGYMGENYVETRCREPGEDAQGDWTQLGRNTTHTGYQLRRALTSKPKRSAPDWASVSRAVDGSCRARCVPDRPANDGNLWSLTGSPIHRFTCIRTDPATAQTDLTRKYTSAGRAAAARRTLPRVRWWAIAMTGIEASTSPPLLPRWFGPRASPDDPAVSALIDRVAQGAGWADIGGGFNLNVRIDAEPPVVLRVHRPWVRRGRVAGLRRLRERLQRTQVRVARPIRISGCDLLRVGDRWAEIEEFIGHIQPPAG